MACYGRGLVMYSRNQVIASCGVWLALMFGGPVNAATIDYIFTGTASITLNGVSSFTTYKIDLVGDTGAVTSGGGEFFNAATSATFAVGASTGTLLGVLNEVISNPSFGGGAAAFGQGQATFPNFVAEGLTQIGSYDLTTAFPLTAGMVSQTPGSVFFTSLGDLVFNGIETMSFEADIASTPLPAALPLFAGGLGTLGLLARRRKRKNAAA